MINVVKNQLNPTRLCEGKSLLAVLLVSIAPVCLDAQILERLNSMEVSSGSSDVFNLQMYISKYRFTSQDFEEDISQKFGRSLRKHYTPTYKEIYGDGEHHAKMLQDDINTTVWVYQQARLAHMKLQQSNEISIRTGTIGFCQEPLDDPIIMKLPSLITNRLMGAYSTKPTKFRPDNDRVWKLDIRSIAGICKKVLPCGDHLHVVVLCDGSTFMYFESDRSVQFLLDRKGVCNAELWSNHFEKEEDLFPDFEKNPPSPGKDLFSNFEFENEVIEAPAETE